MYETNPYVSQGKMSTLHETSTEASPLPCESSFSPLTYEGCTPHCSAPRCAVPTNPQGGEKSMSAVKEPSYYQCNRRTLVMENQCEEHNKNTSRRKMRMFLCRKVVIQGHHLRHVKVWCALFTELGIGAGDASEGPQPALAGLCAHPCPQAWEWP